ncbi:MAG TPA: cell division protein ZapA [Stellaceae bacterium]|jgi:cell division protein ZapA|nr:cell division protein ZapA [Stellaceae bacterium]
MPQVALTINGRSYQVACDDGQEDRIRQLGQYIDSKVTEFAKSWGQIGDARLILMAGLVITDELAEATESLRRERNRGGNGATVELDRVAATESVLAAGIESLAARIEAVALRLESTT